MSAKNDTLQPEINIGVVGHVDHGKTSLTEKLTNISTDRHSDEIKQGISIKLGYADACFYKCIKCSGVQAYGVSNKCNLCHADCEIIKKVSFVDAPGHETLMAVMLSGATLLNGAILVIAANEECPQPRTVEHFSALKMHGIKNIVVAQNKIDLVTKEIAKENYLKIKQFLKKEGYDHVPIIPTSAHFDINIDALVYALLKTIPTPDYKIDAPLKMRVVRSFDINKPSTDISKLKGGVLGGAIIQGSLKKEQEVFLYPGLDKPLKLKVKSLNSGNCSFEKVHAGGLIAVGTNLDPFCTYGDRMTGQLICDENLKPLVGSKINVKYSSIERLIEPNMPDIKVSEKVVLIIGTAANIGTITKIKKNNLEIVLNKNTVYYLKEKIAISRLVNNRWRLSGYAEIE
jgi:translation initiation factor 2 subunit 3